MSENYDEKKYGYFLKVMEKRLYNFIMRPAMLFSWIFGININLCKWSRSAFVKFMDAN